LPDKQLGRIKKLGEKLKTAVIGELTAIPALESLPIIQCCFKKWDQAIYFQTQKTGNKICAPKDEYY
jgi:hypothetical protein